MKQSGIQLFRLFVALLTGLAMLASPVFGQTCKDNISVHCGKTPSAIVTQQGQLLVVFEQQGHIYLSRSTDAGLTYSDALPVNDIAEKIYTNGENRPKIALGANGEIYISWSKKTAGRFNGDIRFSRSLDNGQNFSAIQTINQDGMLTTHRFDALEVDQAGNVYIVWVDKRDRLIAAEKGLPFKGASIYYAVSTNQGKSFGPNRQVLPNSCECCRIATAPADNGVAIFWRHIFADNQRDHGFAILGADKPISAPKRATTDNWQIDACPHHGPAIAITQKAITQKTFKKKVIAQKATQQNAIAEEPTTLRHHLAWFTNSETRQGIYYGIRNVASADPDHMRLISDQPGASHPAIIARDQHLWLIWKAFDGEQTTLNLIQSFDAGRHWQVPTILRRTKGFSDHPLLFGSPDRVYLGWLTADEGYIVLPLEAGEADAS
ncbi:MAG: glycoside hydrolase [Pseudomonadales bacterium]|nr:glycoside hydrolase [Pseudomonadales bacterium]